MQETVRYNYKLRPGVQAVAKLEREADRSRFTWNQCIAISNDERAKGRDCGPVKIQKYLTAARNDAAYAWLKEGSSVVQQQTIRKWGVSRSRAFAARKKKDYSVGFPKFKSKRDHRISLNYVKTGFKIKEGRLVVAGKISLPVVWSRELPSEPSSVIVYRDSVGDWFASFVVAREKEIFDPKSAQLGIDWGVKSVATTNDSEYDLLHMQYGKKGQAKLTKYQRRMAKRQNPKGKKASKGYIKAKHDAAKQHRKIARQRQDTGRKWARKVVENHGQIAIEDFKPKFLAKSTMARKAADGAIGATKTSLIEYAERAEREYVLVNPAYTTMTCSNCGETRTKLALSERRFHCPDCGYEADRDANAARTILNKVEFVPVVTNSS